MDTRTLIREAGGPAKIARACGITPQAVSQWDRFPEVHCATIENSLGIACERLRPDLEWLVLPDGRKVAVGTRDARPGKRAA